MTIILQHGLSIILLLGLNFVPFGMSMGSPRRILAVKTSGLTPSDIIMRVLLVYGFVDENGKTPSPEQTRSCLYYPACFVESTHRDMVDCRLTGAASKKHPKWDTLGKVISRLIERLAMVAQIPADHVFEMRQSLSGSGLDVLRPLRCSAQGSAVDSRFAPLQLCTTNSVMLQDSSTVALFSIVIEKFVDDLTAQYSHDARYHFDKYKHQLLPEPPAAHYLSGLTGGLVGSLFCVLFVWHRRQRKEAPKTITTPPASPEAQSPTQPAGPPDDPPSYDDALKPQPDPK